MLYIKVNYGTMIKGGQIAMKEQKFDLKEMNKDNNQGEIVIYQNDDGDTKIDVRFVDETVWLTQAQLCELYQTSKSNVSEHIKNIFEEGELEENSTVRKLRTVQNEGERIVTREQLHYNLDMIISLGYRIKSITATQFRRWATERLKEYMIKGFTMDDERLKNLGGGNYWKELLDRIRDIRSSEKVCIVRSLTFMRQVLTIIRKAAKLLPFSKWFKTNCIMRHTVILPPKLFTSVQMQISRLWE